MKTLIVEDDLVMREMITRVLKKRGHEVIPCSTAEQARDLYRKEFFPMILLDLTLPGMDGLSFCQWLRQQPRGEQVFVLVATARDKSADLQAVLEAGGNDYVSKPFDVPGLQVRLAVAERHVEQRQTEQMNQTILRNALDGFWLINREGRILEANAAYCRTIGYTRDELLSLRASDIFLGLSAEAVNDAIQRVSQTGSHQLECQQRHKDGHPIDFEISLNVVDNDDTGRIAVFLHDITERKKFAEEKLKTARLESIGLLAGSIAHEFNNALTTIIGNVALAESELPNQHEAQEWLTAAQNAATKATQLARHLLTFSKGGEPIKQPILLPDLLRAASSNLLRKNHLVHIELDLAPDVPFTMADPNQIVQVIDNLLNNSSESLAKGGHIRLQCRVRSISESEIDDLPPGNFIEMAVTDDGPGIRPEHLSKIFDPHFSTKPQGSGLGLAICLSVLRKHGGAIIAHSEPGIETTFRAYLPIVATPGQPAVPGSVQFSGINRRVLIMDDDADILDLISTILSRAGYSASMCRGGAEALELYAQSRQRGAPYDVVIMDLTIPDGMGGKEAIEKLRTMDPACRVIVCSGYSNDPVMASFEEYGFKARLPKPFTAEDLRRVVQEVLQ